MVFILKKLYIYILVGGFATIIDYISFYICIHKMSMSTSYAIIISILIGTEAHYFASRTAYPRQGITIFKSFIRHHQSILISLIANISIQFIFINYMIISHFSIIKFVLDTSHLSYLFFCKIIATGASFFINFIFINFYVFNGEVSIRNLIKQLISKSNKPQLE